MKVSYFVSELWKLRETFLFGISRLSLRFCNSRVHNILVMYINTGRLATAVRSSSNVLSLHTSVPSRSGLVKLVTFRPYLCQTCDNCTSTPEGVFLTMEAYRAGTEAG